MLVAWGEIPITSVELDAHSVVWALIALTALGGGTAYAATIVARAKLADNALALGGIPAAVYRQDFTEAASGSPVKLAAGGTFRTVLAWTFTSHARWPGPMVFFSQAAVADPGKLAGLLVLRLVVDGKSEVGQIIDSIGPGDVQTVFGVIVCNGMPGGRHVAELQARAAGGELIIDRWTETGLRPLVAPPG